MAKNTCGESRIDGLAGALLHADAACEVHRLTDEIGLDDLTGVEILAVLAILRSAKERFDAAAHTGAFAGISQTRQA